MTIFAYRSYFKLDMICHTGVIPSLLVAITGGDDNVGKNMNVAYKAIMAKIDLLLNIDSKYNHSN